MKMFLGILMGLEFLSFQSLVVPRPGIQSVSAGQSQLRTPQLPDEPRDAKGHLQAFDCGPLVPRRPHKCDPRDFAKALRASKSFAVTAYPSLWGEDREILRKRVESLIRKWGRFRLLEDPDSADLVFELVQTSVTKLGTSEFVPFTSILVWLHGANPETDDVIWTEHYLGKWPRSDTIAHVVELLHKDIEDCERASGAP
jgi:hypothetical protein